MEHLDLRSQIEGLERRAQTAFAALCCERLLSNYEAFQVSEQWGDISALTVGLESAWKYIQGFDIGHNTLSTLQSACKAAAPDTEDFTSLYAELALTTASAIYLLLQAIKDGRPESIIRVAELALTAIDEYLNRVTEPLLMAHGRDSVFDEWVQQAPMFLAEQIAQQENIYSARRILTMTDKQINSLRERERNRGIQPILRGIVKK
jgi:hypothetical protein